jgi:hypothetical protein
MATQTEKTVVYAAAVVRGIALVTFPAASTILTDPPNTTSPTRSTVSSSCPR